MAGDAHRAACHYAETLEDFDVETLRAKVEAGELEVPDLDNVDVDAAALDVASDVASLDAGEPVE